MQLLLDNVTLFDGVKCESDQSVLVDSGKVVAIRRAGVEPLDGVERIDLQGHRLLLGFVDIQINGGGGTLFNDDPSVDGLRRIADAHVRFGTTSLLPTLISDDYDLMRAAVMAVRRAIDEDVPGIIGIHLEGPFLSEAQKGAHDPSKFRSLDDEGFGILTSLGDDAVTLVTLAPDEIVPEHIDALQASGVVVFGGHTAATYDQCVAAERVGLSGYTHLFNGMTPFGSREPGVVGAAIESASAYFGIIADGHHVHPSSLRLAVRSKHRGRAILVTDAMPTVGATDPWFELNGERIEVQDGVLRNAAGSLAGSHLSMIEAVRNAMEFIGIDWQEAVRMASRYPSEAIGRSGVYGRIVEDGRADLIELDRYLKIFRVWRCGKLAFDAS